MQQQSVIASYTVSFECVWIGYGDGETGYLGAVAGNGFGKWQLISTLRKWNATNINTVSYRKQHKRQFKLKKQNL